MRRTGAALLCSIRRWGVNRGWNENIHPFSGERTLGEPLLHKPDSSRTPAVLCVLYPLESASPHSLEATITRSLAPLSQRVFYREGHHLKNVTRSRRACCKSFFLHVHRITGTRYPSPSRSDIVGKFPRWHDYSHIVHLLHVQSLPVFFLLSGPTPEIERDSVCSWVCFSSFFSRISDGFRHRHENRSV